MMAVILADLFPFVRTPALIWRESQPLSSSPASVSGTRLNSPWLWSASAFWSAWRAGLCLSAPWASVLIIKLLTWSPDPDTSSADGHLDRRSKRQQSQLSRKFQFNFYQSFFFFFFLHSSGIKKIFSCVWGIKSCTRAQQRTEEEMITLVCVLCGREGGSGWRNQGWDLQPSNAFSVLEVGVSGHNKQDQKIFHFLQKQKNDRPSSSFIGNQRAFNDK